jgi:hypothetical protein
MFPLLSLIMGLELGTSESDLALLGVGPYEDTLRRLDGGIDHNKNFSKRLGASSIT